MTEAEWQACSDAQVMLDWLTGKTGSRGKGWFTFWRRSSPEPIPSEPKARASNRKLRLFACACCGPIGDLLQDSRGRKALQVAERFADGEVDSQKMNAAWDAAESALDSLRANSLPDALLPSLDTLRAVSWAARAAAATLEQEAIVAAIRTSEAVVKVAEEVAAWDGPWAARIWARAALLRDIVGNPFRTISIDPEWLIRNDATVRKIAQQIYSDRSFGDLPILADALIDAGCHDEEVLNHCRQTGGHVRGCWALDLLLGKE